MRFALDCTNTPETCDHCDRPICPRCDRCFEKVAHILPGVFRFQCPSASCRFLKWVRQRVLP